MADASGKSDGPDDEVLLGRYRIDGDLDALDQLVERYRRPLLAYITRYNDRDGAEDVLQEVWLRILRKPQAFRGGHFSGWLFRVCRNLLIDRSRKRRELCDTDITGGTGTALSDALADPSPGPVETIIQAEQVARLQAILDVLPPNQAEVFVMRTQAGLRFREIAVAQRCSINTVLARMRYALDRIRRAMSESNLETKP